MFKTFNAKLHGVLLIHEGAISPIDTTIKFSKNRIILKDDQLNRLHDNPFSTTPISSNSTYEFYKTYNKEDRKVFAVKIEGHSTQFVLDISLMNKIRANLLHTRYWIQVSESNWFKQALLAGILSISGYFIGQHFGLKSGYQDGLEKGRQQYQKYLPQKLRDSLHL